MRASLVGYFPSLVAGCLAAVACGGGQAATDAPRLGEPSSTEPSSAGAAGSASSPVDGSPSTTTAVTLGDAGDLQGAKLTESHTVAATPSGSAPAPKAPHSHDPGRGPADIRAIVVAHRDEARSCYDKALPSHPGLEGNLVVQWTIDPKGTVTQVSLDSARSQITEPGVVACIGDVVRKIKFAASPGGFETKAFYPFNFHPRHAGTQQGPEGEAP